MFVKKVFVLLSIILLSACGVNQRYYQQATKQVEPNLAFISEKSPTLPPYGYVQFCRDNPHECPEQFNHTQQFSHINSQETTASTNPTVAPLNPFNLTQNLRRLINNDPQERQRFNNIITLLDSVNNEVNGAISQVSDMEGFGVVENWRIPSMGSIINDIGDCEDFALAKRKVLIDRYGFNRNALSMSVLRRPDGDIHAVLMVRTAYGDYVLDNLEDEVLPWNKTGYHWMKKQAFGNPGQWISL